jgi:CO/xanthine dehydrogenase Mo-binding subunit
MFRLPGSAAIRALPSGGYTVSLGAADIGTGAWTALTQIAADALGVPIEDVDLQIGDSDLRPPAGGRLVRHYQLGHLDRRSSRPAQGAAAIRAQRRRTP